MTDPTKTRGVKQVLGHQLSVRYELAGKRGVLQCRTVTLTPQLENLLQLLAAEEVE